MDHVRHEELQLVGYLSMHIESGCIFEEVLHIASIAVKMTTCRITKNPNSIRINMILSGVRFYKAHCAFHIMDTGWKNRLTGQTDSLDR
jgi:hypothetical protein